VRSKQLALVARGKERADVTETGKPHGLAVQHFRHRGCIQVGRVLSLAGN
jgi:hypothetical protein